MDMDKQEFEMVVAELEDNGYEEAAPAGAEVDREIVESEPCTDCGGAVKFRPFRTPGLHSSYRAFAQCQQCGGAYEF